MSPSPTVTSLNNNTVTTASSAAVAAIALTAATTESQTTESQTTTVPGTELPVIPPRLPPFTDFGHSRSSSPSESSEVRHINHDNDDRNYEGNDDINHESEYTEEEEDDEVEDGEDSEFMPGLFGSHNGDGDYTASQFSVQQRIMHFLGERIDHQKNRINVEICLLVEAGTAVTNERGVSTDMRNQMMLDKYRNLVRAFSRDDFVSPSTQDDMSIKLYNGKSKDGYTGDKL